MPYTTTATEFQRNYKKVSKRIKSLKDGLIVLSNNKPDLVVMGYDQYLQNYEAGKATAVGFSSANNDLLSLVGTMTNEEADKLNKDMDEMFENIDEEDWKWNELF